MRRNLLRAQLTKHVSKQPCMGIWKRHSTRSYVWFRHMQARDMALTDEILRGKAMQLGPRFEVSAMFGCSPGLQ
jgi:hypothetical protein